MSSSQFSFSDYLQAFVKLLTVLFKRVIWTVRMITVINTTPKTPRQAIRIVFVISSVVLATRKQR